MNPDDIALQLAPDQRNDTAIMLRAGRIAAQQRRSLIQTGQSLAMETTLTGHSELRTMADARAAGYKITLVFVGVGNALISLVRVRERVARGGHSVPEQVVLRRFAKSLANLPKAIEYADRAFVLDNTGSRHRLLVAIDQGRVKHRTARLPVWITPALSWLTPCGAAALDDDQH